MKILLIAANNRAQGEPSLGIGYLASYLKKYLPEIGISIKIMNYIPKDLSKIIKFSPDIIGISALTKQYKNAILFAREIKKTLNAPIIIGGHHLSMAPHSFDPVFDLAVLGEGEQTFLEFIKYFARNGLKNDGLGNIKGLMYRKDGKIITTEKRELIEPLDNIPYPARELFNMEFMLDEKKNVFGQSFGRGTHMFTSRGCPFKCVFCSASAFWKKIRYNSPEYVIGEMNELINKYKVKLIHVYDDLFPANKKRLGEIVEMIKKEGINKKVDFGMFGRADIFDEETCRLLKEMNTVFIEFGIESGTQKVLDFLKGGRIKIKQIEGSIALCKKYGITTGGTFIIGTPGETEEEMLQTLKFIKKLSLDKFSFFTLSPYPGTPLWDYAVKEGILPKDVNWDTFEMKKIEKLREDDILYNSGQILIDKSISPKRFVEIFNLFEKERTKLYDYKWDEAIAEEEPDS